MKLNVCLVCLKPFQNDLSKNTSCCELPSFTKFLKFAKNYLQVSSVATRRLLSGITGGNAVFCDNCDSTVITPIYQVCSQILCAQARLSVELERLLVLVDNSTSDSLDIDGIYYLKPFRSLLAAKCQLRRQEFLPRLILQRLIVTQKTPQDNGQRDKTCEKDSDWVVSDDDDDDRIEILSVADHLESCNETSTNEKTEDGNELLIQIIKKPEVDIKNEYSEDPNEPALHHKLECSTCCKIFVTGSSLKRHYRDFHQPTPCRSCSRTFGGAELQRKHWARIHAPKGKFPCPICSKMFFTQYNMAFHKRTAHGHFSNQETFLCHMCPKVFPSLYKLRYHKRIKHDPKKSHNCSICSLSFTSISALKYHVFAAHKPKTLPCAHCEKNFSHNQLLQRHISSCHTEGPKLKPKVNTPHFCPVCSKVYCSFQTMRLHLKQTHGSEQKNHSCIHCQKVYKTKEYLRRHVRSIHKPITVVCLPCERVFTQKVYLKRHIARWHPNSEPVKGDKEQKLIEPFTCEKCGKLFSSSNAVTTHVSEVHNQKWYSCTECKLSCKTKYQLMEHLKVHNPETHICEHCGKVFTMDRYLRRHIRKRH